jgi:vancomycin resistance protein YoaR
VAAVLTLKAGADGSIQATADPAKVAAAFVPLIPQLPTATPTDAKISLVNGKPHITPSISAVTPDPSGIAADIPAAIVSPTRTITVPGKATDPAFTTADAEKLGIKQLVGTEDPNDGMTPHPCCRPRVTNLHIITGIVNNAIILPGQVFSLNKFVGQRTAARGFVNAPEIDEGTEKTAIGGGVSQFATTMFNAVYFSGMKIIEHQPHTFWIARYPAGREATVSWPEPDLVWQNDTPYGILVQSWDDGVSTHVRFWSTPYWQVQWGSSPRTDITPVVTTYLAPGESVADCQQEAETGETGFSITIWRILSLNGKQDGPEQSWFHRYSPQPDHICTPNPSASPSPGTSGSPKPTTKPTGAAPGKSPTPTPTTKSPPPSPTPSPTPKS